MRVSARLLALLGSICAIQGAHAAGRIGPIHFEDTVPPWQAATLTADYRLLSSLPLNENSPRLKALLGVPTLEPATLRGWLAERIQVIVGESYELDDNLFVAPESFEFPNPGRFPTHETATAPPSTTSIRNMANLGAGVYLRGKRAGKLLGMRFQGYPDVLGTSPRMGVIQVGPGLFGNKLGFRASARAHAIPRLATLFHEARHGDGNGQSAIFPHAVCPPNHDLAGYNACDRNLNGPYTVSGMMIRALVESCSTCTRREREALRVRYLEAFGRVIQVSADGTRSTAWDPRPEGRRR